MISVLVLNCQINVSGLYIYSKDHSKHHDRLGTYRTKRPVHNGKFLFLNESVANALYKYQLVDSMHDAFQDYPNIFDMHCYVKK